MGCGLTKEKLQTEILVLQLEKAEIEEERERLIRQLQLLSFHGPYKKPNLQKKNKENEVSLTTKWKYKEDDISVFYNKYEMYKYSIIFILRFYFWK